jgi:phospholipid/cholesterol/gamma-HCH transport system substrate-binding protein
VRRGPQGISPVVAGAITLGLAVMAAYFGFTKAIPFRDHFEIKAAFKTANDLKAGNAVTRGAPVRIAGVKVGEVTEVKGVGGGSGTVLTMRIDDRSVPIRADARMKIRPRIFLEGNYFVDVSPGTPGARKLREGETIPVQQTATPVQYGQFLTVFQSDARRNLQTIFQEYGRAVSGRGGRGFNRSIQYWETAYRDSARVNEATLGLLEHDLSGYIRGAGAVARALDRDPAALKGLITDLSTFAGALAVEADALEAAIAELPRTLSVGYRALGSLNDAFPAVRRFIAAMRPAARSARPALDAQLPFLVQSRQLVSRRELRGLVADLRPLVPDLVELNRGGIALQRQVRALASCQNNVILPFTGDRIPDERFPATGRVFEEAPKSLVGLAGESRSFDANGQYVRSFGASASFAYALGDGRNFFTMLPLQGVQPPKALQGRPPLRPNVPCETQEPPDLRTQVQAPPAARSVNHNSPPAQELYQRSYQALVEMIDQQARQMGTPIDVSGPGPRVRVGPGQPPPQVAQRARPGRRGAGLAEGASVLGAVAGRASGR